MKRQYLLLALLVSGPAFGQSATDTERTPVSTFTGFAAPGLNVLSGSGSFTETESTMSSRFYRSGAPGEACTEAGSGSYQFQEVVLHADSSGMLTVSFDPQTLGSRVYVTFHTQRFNPSSICQNYVWANGSSTAFTQRFSVPPNAELRMVVSAVQNAPTVFGGPYTYTVTGANATPTAAALPVATPTLDGLGLILMTLVLGSIGLAGTSRQS